MIDRAVLRRMMSIARALDASGATDLSDRIEMMLRASQIGGSDYSSTDPGAVQGTEPTLRHKPVRPFIGDGFEEDDERVDKGETKPPSKRRRTKGYEVGVDVALHTHPSTRGDGQKKVLDTR